ncbi:MAG: 50S ribosomal protein L3 [candidate division WOR-3 bacterium]
MKAILGRKLGMSQVFLESGEVVPVTLISAGPCVVTQRKTAATDGYEAVQIGFEPTVRINRPGSGLFAKNKLAPMRVLREVRVGPEEKLEVGSELRVDLFAEGDLVDVIGRSKGRGFAGGMKRWGWAGGPASHGSMSHRRIGSVGSNTYPGRPWRGRTLPGRYGDEQVTVKNLRIVRVDNKSGVIYLRGAIPGGPRGIVLIRGTGRRVTTQGEAVSVGREKR